MRLLRCTLLDQPTVDNGGVRRGMSVAVTVGCWLLAVGTSMALQWHFNGTLMALQRNLNNTSMSHKKMPHNFFSFCFFCCGRILFMQFFADNKRGKFVKVLTLELACQI